MENVCQWSTWMRRALLNLAVVDSAERIYGAILELAKQN